MQRNSYKEPIFLYYFVALIMYLALLTYWIICSESPVLRRFAWGSFGGAVTGLQNFLKDALTISKDTHGASYPWFFYLFILFAAGSAFGGLLMLTACMKRYDAAYSAASFVGSFVVSASIMSAVHYNTFAFLDTVWNYVLYPVGLAVLIVGVYVLVLESREVSDDDDNGTTESRSRKDSDDSQVSQTKDDKLATSQ